MDKRTLGQVLKNNITHHGTRLAVIETGASWTYQEFGARVTRLAAHLNDLGLVQGDRFAVYAKNGSAYEELRWAGFISGIVPVAVNWRLAPPEIEHVLKDSGSEIIFIEEGFQAVFERPY